MTQKLILAWVLALASTACSDQKPIGDPAGSNNFDDPFDPGQSGINTGAADASSDASGRFCVAARDCPAAFVCAYPLADTCGAAGRCLPFDVTGCDAGVACGCDNTAVMLCAPTGYAPKPVKSQSSCNAGDGGVPPVDAASDAASD